MRQQEIIDASMRAKPQPDKGIDGPWRDGCALLCARCDTGAATASHEADPV